jgi:hypothetical protein
VSDPSTRNLKNPQIRIGISYTSSDNQESGYSYKIALLDNNYVFILGESDISHDPTIIAVLGQKGSLGKLGDFFADFIEHDYNYIHHPRNNPDE